MKSSRSRSPKRAAQIAASSTARPDWARFVIEKGTDHPHKKKKGRGSYTRKAKHKDADGE